MRINSISYTPINFKRNKETRKADDMLRISKQAFPMCSSTKHFYYCYDMYKRKIEETSIFQFRKNLKDYKKL